MRRSRRPARERLFAQLVARLLARHLERFGSALAKAGVQRRREIGLGFLRSRALGDKRSWRLLFEVLANASRDHYGLALAARFAERRALVAAQLGGENAEAKALVLDALMVGLAAERLAGASEGEVEAALDEFERLTR